MFKRSGGKGLVFYDVFADGLKLQVFADARNFSDFQDDTGLERFMKLMNETKVRRRQPVAPARLLRQPRAPYAQCTRVCSFVLIRARSHEPRRRDITCSAWRCDRCQG